LSAWAASLLKWTRRNLIKYFVPCHKIFLVYLSTMWKLFHDMVEYSLTSHGIFCHVTSMVCFEINNGLLIMNMGLAKKVVKNNIMWMFENKKKLKDAFYHPSCNQWSNCLMLLENNYNIFKNVEMSGNCILEKYLMKINFSKYINYLTNMCWNGRGIKILYINIHHFND
jgi:hypothetical protein